METIVTEKLDLKSVILEVMPCNWILHGQISANVQSHQRQWILQTDLIVSLEV